MKRASNSSNNSLEEVNSDLATVQKIAKKQRKLLEIMKKDVEQAEMEAMNIENYVMSLQMKTEAIKRKGNIEETFYRSHRFSIQEEMCHV